MNDCIICGEPCDNVVVDKSTGHTIKVRVHRGLCYDAWAFYHSRYCPMWGVDKEVSLTKCLMNGCVMWNRGEKECNWVNYYKEGHAF